MEAVDAIIIGFIFLMLIGVGLAVYYVFYFRKKGEKCTPEKDADKFGIYQYNDKKECVLSNCLTDYKLTDGKCVKNTSLFTYKYKTGPDLENIPCDFEKVDTSPCVRYDGTTWSGITLNRGQTADKYKVTKKEVGKGDCKINNSVNMYELPKFGDFYYHVKKCPVNCEWITNNEPAIQYACYAKYIKGGCIPLGDSGTIDTDKGYIKLEAVNTENDTCPREPDLISCKVYGYKECPTPTPTPPGSTAGCGANTNWSVVPKFAGSHPNHSDYITQPASGYCKSDTNYNIADNKAGKYLYPIVDVKVQRCNNTVIEEKNVKGRWLLDFNVIKGFTNYKLNCNDIGAVDNCSTFENCNDVRDIKVGTEIRNLVVGSRDFDIFLK